MEYKHYRLIHQISSILLLNPHCLQIYVLFHHYRKPQRPENIRENVRSPLVTTPSVMPNIHPRPNLHAQHHNLDTLERLVFEDFNGSPYASKSTIVISGWETVFCNCGLLRRKFEFIDPRGYINIAWLFVQVKLLCLREFLFKKQFP